MKLGGAKVAPFLAGAPAPGQRILLYGPDQGLVRERALSLAGRFTGGAGALAVTEIPGARVKQDPARLADGLSAFSLMGDDQAVVIRDATDAIGEAVADVLDGGADTWPLIVEAGDLPPRSKLRKLFEGHETAVAIACYVEEGRDLEAFIKGLLAEDGLRIETDALAYLAGRLAGNRQAVRREVEKLALSRLDAAPDDRKITVEVVDAAIGDSREASLETLIYAVASGNRGAVDAGLEKAFSEGINAVAVLRAAGNHFQRLHRVVAAGERGGSPDKAMSALRPPIFFKRRDAFRDQVRRWDSARVATAFDILAECEMACKTTGMPAELLCARALMRLAQAAVRR